MAQQSQTKRTVPMQVLSLGMLRTGTLSMQAALHILGFQHTYHGFDSFESESRGDFAHWERAAEAKYFGKGKIYGREEFDSFLGNCAAATDLIALYTEDFITAYPDAKVILVERDINRWYESFDEAVLKSLFQPAGFIIIYVLQPILGFRAFSAMRKSVLGYFKASNVEEIRANAKKVYKEHNATVRRLVKPEKLLEYKLGSGWEPLCAFLGVEIPKEDFPWINERGEIAQRQRNEIKKALRECTKMVLPAISVGAVTAAALAIFYAKIYTRI